MTMLTSAEQSELEMLRSQVAKMKAAALAKATSRISVKVRPLGEQDKDGVPFKGNIAVYGLAKFPITLYPGQWIKLLDKADEIRAEIELYRDQLSWKD